MSFLGKKPADQVTSGQQIANNTITGNKLVDGIITAAKMAAGSVVAHLGYTPVDQSFEVGRVCFYARNTAPTGYLKANGAAVSRTTYAALFASIGTTFGVGDGSSTFNLPDMRGYFPRGWDDGAGIDSGRTFGSSQADDFKSHTHYISGFGNGSDLNGGPYADGGTRPASYTATYSGGAETRPKNIALLACIRY